MSVSIRDAHNSPQDLHWIEAQYAEYLKELSELSANTGVFPALGLFGERREELVARFFADDASHPLIILKNNRPVGFALVSRPARLQPARCDFRMAEFFITTQERRLGVGREAAQLIFKRFAGRWEISEFLSNKPAVTFWRSTVSDFSGGRYREEISQGEVRQSFRSDEARTTPR